MARLNLEAIESALDGMMAAAKAKPGEWKKLHREKLGKAAAHRLLEGYAYVDRLLAEAVDPFAYGNSEHLVELNHLVLCGSSPQTRRESAAHIEQTESYFYDNRLGGVGDFVAWYTRNRSLSPPLLASGSFVVVASAPQLFIEGNQRTATLIASFVLARRDLPPLVATAQNYGSLFPHFAQAKAIDRSSWRASITVWRLRSRLAASYQRTANPKFLL